jgi:high-affinity Fe2+/Pb2+ permease
LLIPSAPGWIDAAAGVAAAFVLTLLFYAYQRLRFSEIDLRSRERIGK